MQQWQYHYKVPQNTKADVISPKWLTLALKDFFVAMELCKFSLCFGEIDGNHIVIVSRVYRG